MKVIVGSTNPVKINATKNAFSRFFENIEVTGIKVDSEVSNMPRSRNEIRQGALNRAKKSLINGADFGVGLEGGVHENEHGMFLFGISAVIDKNNNIGLASAEGFLLPEKVAIRIRKGEELGPVMDNILNQTNVKKKGGAIGAFTRGHISRTDSFEQSVIMALVKFINKDMYDLK